MKVGEKTWNDRIYKYVKVSPELSKAIPYVTTVLEPEGTRTVSCPEGCTLFVSYEVTAGGNDGNLPTKLPSQGFSDLGTDVLEVSENWTPGGMRTWKKTLAPGKPEDLKCDKTFVGLLAIELA